MLAQNFQGTLEFDHEREPQVSARLFGVEKCSIDELTLRRRSQPMTIIRPRRMGWNAR